MSLNTWKTVLLTAMTSLVFVCFASGLVQADDGFAAPHPDSIAEFDVDQNPAALLRTGEENSIWLDTSFAEDFEAAVESSSPLRKSVDCNEAVLTGKWTDGIQLIDITQVHCSLTFSGSQMGDRQGHVLPSEDGIVMDLGSRQITAMIGRDLRLLTWENGVQWTKLDNLLCFGWSTARQDTRTQIGPDFEHFYQYLGDLGYVARHPVAGMKPLYVAWSSSRADTRTQVGGQVESMYNHGPWLIGYVFENPVAGTVPLYLGWSSQRQDTRTQLGPHFESMYSHQNLIGYILPTE